MSARRLVIVCAAAALAACADASRDQSDSAGGDDTTTAPAAASSSPEARVSEVGFGALRIGMTATDARDALGTLELGSAAEGSGCLYAFSAALPRGVSVMIENGSVVRIDVDSAGVVTADGVGIGDSEQRVLQVYGERARVGPHKYTDGHYVTVRGTRDDTHLIVFETHHDTVTSFRAGRVPQVEYVEGCS